MFDWVTLKICSLPFKKGKMKGNWVHSKPVGEFRNYYGTFKYTVVSAAATFLVTFGK